MKLNLAALMLTASMLIAPTLNAQPSDTPPDIAPPELVRFGVYGGMQLTAFDAALTGLPKVISCAPLYESGAGSGFAVGLGVESKLDLFSASGRILYVHHNGTLATPENVIVATNGEAGSDTATATFMHTIDITQPALSTEIFGGYAPIANLRLLAGIRLDVPLGSTATQREEIVAPGTIRYAGGTRRRDFYSGPLNDEAPMHFAIALGVRYDLPLNDARTVLLAPEALLWQGFGNVAGDDDWTVNGLRLGLNLIYVLRTDDSSPIEPIREDKPTNDR